MALTRPSAARLRRLRALGELHHEWVTARLSERTRFDPRGEDSDYNIHHIDVEVDGRGEDGFSLRARRIFGLDPETGRRP